MTVIRVINQGSDAFSGRYDGTDYHFEVGKAVDIPFEVARHCFGFGESDKREALSRMGWLKPFGSMKEALERLSAIRFLEGTVTFEDSVELTDQSGRSAANARPHVNRRTLSLTPSSPPTDDSGAKA